MNAPRFVRGTKSRLFLYLGALSFVGLVVYVYHGAQIQLEDVRLASEKCQQQQESLSAQLQVIFEYKLRLEKSLQQEKNDHRQTKEELQSKADEEKTLKDTEILETMNKYTSLKQEHKLLKGQHEDLDEECNKVRILQLQGLEEKSTLEGQVQAVQQELVQIQAAREKELENLKSHYMQLELELEKLTKTHTELASKSQQSNDRINYLEKQNFQLERELSKSKDQYKSCQRRDEIKSHDAPNPINVILEKPKPQEKEMSVAVKPKSTSPSGIQPKPDQPRFLDEPDKENADKAGMKSTTPQINPEAIGSQDRVSNNVVPMPPPSKDRETAANAPAPPIAMPREQQRSANHGGADWRKQVPAGVVPAPNVYDNNRFNKFREVPAADHENQLNEMGRGQNANPWGWNYRQPEHPGFVHQNNVPNQHDNLLRIQYLNNRNNEHPGANDFHHQRGQLDVNDLHHQREQLVANNFLNQREQLVANDFHHQQGQLNGNDLHHQREKLVANDFHNQRGQLEGPDHDNNDRGDNKEIPRNVKQAYAYNGDYEKDGQKNDLQLEEAEDEGDDDVDQIDYEGAKQNVNNHANEHKRPMVMAQKQENRDGVMVNPKR